MALPDAATYVRRSRRRVHPDHVFAMLAAPVAAVATALWVVELATGPASPVPGVTIVLWVTAAVLVVAWLVTSLERRLTTRLERIEGSIYRDGYADGFLDAANRRNDSHYERPTLRPVR
jgi:ABC-type transport system involved in cytochrome bd biosynthesis fused ATPase/permease subunit